MVCVPGPTMTQSFSILFPSEGGEGLRTPHRKQLPFPAFLSLFTFHSSLDRSSLSFPYGFGRLNFSRHSCFQFFSECPIPATIISTTVHTC